MDSKVAYRCLSFKIVLVRVLLALLVPSVRPNRSRSNNIDTSARPLPWHVYSERIEQSALYSTFAKAVLSIVPLTEKATLTAYHDQVGMLHG